EGARNPLFSAVCDGQPAAGDGGRNPAAGIDRADLFPVLSAGSPGNGAFKGLPYFRGQLAKRVQGVPSPVRALVNKNRPGRPFPPGDGVARRRPVKAAERPHSTAGAGGEDVELWGAVMPALSAATTSSA